LYVEGGQDAHPTRGKIYFIMQLKCGLAYPDRPFYARSDAEAAKRCEQQNREATRHPDATGRTYYTCDEKKRKNR